MKGLLLKDFFYLKKSARQLPVLFILMAVCMIPANGMGGLIVFSCVMCAMLTITTFSLDERCKWDKYAMIMPLSRKIYVREKYILHLCLTILGSLVGTVLGYIVGLFIPTVESSVMELLLCILVGCIVSLLFGSILIPLSFRFGTEKARIYIIAVYAIPALFIFLAYGAGKKFLEGRAIDMELVEKLLWGFGILGGIIVLLIPVISYHISIRIFLKKEF